MSDPTPAKSGHDHGTRDAGGRWRKGVSGNPAGPPKGTRHRATLVAEAILDGETEALTRKAVELALAGDVMALRLALERIVPPRKDRPVLFQLPPLVGAGDGVAAIAAVTQAVAEGDLTPGEAGDLIKLVEAFLKAFEATELERRIVALEARESSR